MTAVNDKADGYISVTGSVTDAAKAFSVTFHNYRGPDKRTDRAPEQAASAPASVGHGIIAVTGLDNATHEMQPGRHAAAPALELLDGRHLLAVLRAEDRGQ